MSPTRLPEQRSVLPFLLLFFVFYGVGARPLPSQPSFPLPTPPPPRPESVNINPVVAGLIAFTVSSLFFAIFITIYILDCTSPPSSPGLNLPDPKGLDLEVIGGFSMFVYSEVKEHKIGKGALECAVCLCEFQDYETLRLIPNCDHVFHQECIDEWLSGHVTCPVCRANLAPPSGDSVKGRTDCSGPEGQHHVEIDIDEEATVASEEVIQGKNEGGVAEQSNGDLGRESHSSKPPHRLGRSHSTGHLRVHHRDDTERFTLRLPDEVRKQIMERLMSPYFPSDGSSGTVISSGDGAAEEGSKEGSISSTGWTGLASQRGGSPAKRRCS